MAGFLAAVACFVLLPFVGQLYLRVFPSIAHNEGLAVFAFFWIPVLVALQITFSFTAGVITFFVAKVRLPDRGWSGEAFAITSAVVAILGAIANDVRLSHWEPPEPGPQQTGLPSLALARTLTLNGKAASTWHLAWSTDGERLAGYVGSRTIIWSSDGKSVSEAPHSEFSSDVLHFAAGHALLITGPTPETGGEEPRRMRDIAFSIIDTETGKMVRDIPGPHPGTRGSENKARLLAVSPDERWIAVVCDTFDRQINIFSTSDWKQVATIDIGADKRQGPRPSGLAFSPDGKTLAVLEDSQGRIKLYEVGSWSSTGSFVTFPDTPFVESFAFSPDGTMIAVASFRGGSWWVDENNSRTRPGWGTFKPQSPADPLRIFRVTDGKLVASLGSFPGGLPRDGLIWSPAGDYIVFLDALGALRVWSPFRLGLSVPVVRPAESPSHASASSLVALIEFALWRPIWSRPPAPVAGTHPYGHNLAFSKDGSQLATNFPDGVKVFEVVAGK